MVKQLFHMVDHNNIFVVGRVLIAVRVSFAVILCTWLHAVAHCWDHPEIDEWLSNILGMSVHTLTSTITIVKYVCFLTFKKKKNLNFESGLTFNVSRCSDNYNNHVLKTVPTVFIYYESSCRNITYFYLYSNHTPYLFIPMHQVYVARLIYRTSGIRRYIYILTTLPIFLYRCISYTSARLIYRTSGIRR